MHMCAGVCSVEGDGGRGLLVEVHVVGYYVAAPLLPPAQGLSNAIEKERRGEREREKAGIK